MVLGSAAFGDLGFRDKTCAILQNAVLRLAFVSCCFACLLSFSCKRGFNSLTL